MTDKTAVSEPGSVANPLGPTPEEAASKWKKLLEVGTPESKEFIAEASAQMLPALELAEKLGMHANSLMLVMKMLQKGKEKEAVDKEKMVTIIERIHPILTLKETLDVYVSNSCEHLLDELEKL